MYDYKTAIKCLLLLYFRDQNTNIQEITSKYEIRQAGKFDNHNSQVNF